jgi:hypothetical protein
MLECLLGHDRGRGRDLGGMGRSPRRDAEPRGWKGWRQSGAPVGVPPRPGPPGKCSRGPGGGGLGLQSCVLMAQRGSSREKSRHSATGRVRRRRGRRPESPCGRQQLVECGPEGACIRQSTGRKGEKVGHGSHGHGSIDQDVQRETEEQACQPEINREGTVDALQSERALRLVQQWTT